MGSSMVDVKKGGLILSWVNGEPHQMLGGRTSLFNGQGQIFEIGSDCYPWIRVVPTNERKKTANVFPLFFFLRNPLICSLT